MRLAILVGSGVGLVLLGVNVISGGGGSTGESRAQQAAAAAPVHLRATLDRVRLPQALHGEAVAATRSGLLVIGGEDGSGTSTDRVYRLSPTTREVTAEGTLAQPLHDAAATTVQRQTLVFGGGNTSTLNLVQALSPGGAATPVGRLPAALSDLSAVRDGAAAYVIGGFDGNRPSASVFETTNGRAFTRVARLPTAVRYAAVAALPDKIYVFGGELAGGGDTNEIQEYDIATERAVVAGHLPKPVSHASAVTLDGGLYLLGGRVAGTGTDRILRFNPFRNLTRPAGHLPQPVFDGAAATYGGHAYLIGGLGRGGSPLASVIRLG
jgi:hypothetical protein